MQIPYNKWFYAAMTVSASLMLVYILSHVVWQDKGYKRTTLSARQTEAIRAIIISKDSTCESEISAKQQIQNYVINQFGDDSAVNIKSVKDFIDKQSLLVISITATTYLFDVKSFFWLTGNLIYLELLFWIWFGLLSSVLYNGIMQKAYFEFKKELIYDHIGKFAYGTMVAVVLYLATDILTTKELTSTLSVSYGSIVYVFILGFFHNRAIDLLDRLKDVLIPSTKPKNNEAGTITASVSNIAPGNIAVVELTNVEDNTTITKNTNKNGLVEFKNIDFAEYNLSISEKTTAAPNPVSVLYSVIPPKKITVDKSKKIEFKADLTAKTITEVVK